MAGIKLITDSGSDITQERAKQLGIRVVPVSFTFDGETYYKDGVDMSVEKFYTMLRESGQIPKTTQITPTEFVDIFNEEYDNGFDTLIVPTISSNGSGIYQNAMLASREVMEERGGEIIVLDSQGFTCIYGAGIVHAAKMLKSGSTKEEIVEYLTNVFKTMHCFFLVGDLTHLKKGGRINAATLVLANMLDLKPVLTVGGGLVVQKDKLRGSKRLIKKFVDFVENEDIELSGRSAIIVHTAQNEKCEELKAELEERFEGIKVMQCPIGAIVGCHGGPDLIGIVFSDKYDFTDYED